MPRIKVTPEEVRQISRQFKQASQESQRMTASLQGTMNTLQPNWEGITKQRFYGEYEQWRVQMNQFVQTLAQIGQELDAIAEKFAVADQG